MKMLGRILRGTWVAIIVSLAAGCGGGGGGSSGTTTVAPQSVEGIATPNDISVVTANNAGN